MHHQLLRGGPLQRRLSCQNQRHPVGGMRSGTAGFPERMKRHPATEMPVVLGCSSLAELPLIF